MYIQSSIVGHKNLSESEIAWLEEVDPDDFVLVEGDDSEPHTLWTLETWQAYEFDNPDFLGYHIVFDNDHPQADFLKRLGTASKGYWSGETLITVEDVSANE